MEQCKGFKEGTKVKRVSGKDWELPMDNDLEEGMRETEGRNKVVDKVRMKMQTQNQKTKVLQEQSARAPGVDHTRVLLVGSTS